MSESLAPEQPEPDGPTVPIARVMRIAVKKLFGILNHTVDLRREERVTLALGENGVGKTHLLECVSALFTGSLDRLQRVPFQEFRVDLDDGRSVRVTQLPIDPEQTALARRVRRGRRFSPRPDLQVELMGEVGQQPMPWVYSAHEGPKGHWPHWIVRLTDGEFFDTRAERTISRQFMMREFGARVVEDVPPPKWFSSVRERTSVRLIETQRLIRTKPRSAHHAAQRDADESPIRATVADVAEEVLELIRKVRDEYTKEAAELDRTYVDRFLDSPDREPPDALSLDKELADKARRQARLQKLALLPSDAGTSRNRLIKDITQDKRHALALYGDDMEKKLKKLEPTAARIEALVDGMNRKLRNKQLVPDINHGLRIQSEQDKWLNLETLSSGEQHELVVLYELLFRVKENSLVLIDEPELSLHPKWQQQFVEDLLSISKARSFDVLAATHSPYMVGHRSHLCVLLSDEAAAS